MKSLSPTKKLLIFCLVMNLAVWSSYGFIFWQIRAQNRAISKLLHEAELDIKRDETLRLIKASLNENKDFISHIDSYFISTDGIVDFIEMIEALGKESNISLNIGSVQVEPDTKNKDDYKELLKLRVESTGSWEGINYFLSVVENLPYRIKIDRAEIMKDSGDPALGGWKGYIEFTALKLK